LNPQYTSDRIAARLEINDLILKFGRAIDRRDWKLLRSIYHEDGGSDHGFQVGKADQLVEWLKARHSTISQSMHIISNILIEFADDNTALVEAYSQGPQRYTAAVPVDQMSGAMAGGITGTKEVASLIYGRYVVEVQRRNDVWKIFNMNVIVETIKVGPVEGQPEMHPSWTVQRRDQDDLLMIKRRQYKLP
jgi:hypothetical protein